jgi:hypothetical protein
MVHDLALGRTVLFGGVGPRDRYRDTWEWDGEDWSRSSAAISPSERYHHAMAYDLAHQRTVLFGGEYTSWFGGTLIMLDDTWLYGRGR